MIVLTILLSLSAAWWLAQGVGLALSTRSVPVLNRLNPPALPTWPKLSIIIPARNEQAHLREAIQARLAEGYPNLEIVLVDDRSTDETPRIAAECAQRDSRIIVTRVDELPAGWLGKVNALQQGLNRATGDWVLFSDADVMLAPGTLSKIIAWAEPECDHVAGLPSLTSNGPLITAALGSFFRMIVGLGRLWSVADPNSSASIGVGAFNLFRRSAFDRTEGLAWLKMDIADDFALGLLLKRSGARSRVLVAGRSISLAFYDSASAMVTALEKNGATTFFPVMMVGQVILLSLELAPVAALVFGTPLQQVCAIALWVFSAAVQGLCARWVSLPVWPALLPFWGVVPLAYAIGRSALQAFIRGGVRWRGTFYSTAEVRAGAKVGKSL